MNLEQRVFNEIDKYLKSDKVETAVNKAMDSVMNDLFTSYGSLNKVIKETLQESLTPAIEGHDYSEYVLKLETVLQQILKERAFESNKLLENFAGAVATKEKEVKLSEIFEKYCKYVSKNVDTSELEVRYEDEPYYENIECSMEYTKQETFWSDKESGIVEFNCENDSNLSSEIRLSSYYTVKDKFYLHTDISSNISKLRFLNDFEVYLLSLDLNHVDIILDEHSMSDDDVEVEAQPECDWS